MTRHEWTIDWFKVWPDSPHAPEEYRPKHRLGTHVHGFVVLPSGDLVFNFEHLGLVRMDPCGKVVWRLPRLTHHSVVRAEDGTLWVSASNHLLGPVSKHPELGPGLIEDVALQVSEDGHVLQEVSMLDLLVENGYSGLLHMHDGSSGDVTHLNDVEPFPASMPPGVFGPGDVLISLRNLNTVLVFTLATRKIKFIHTGDVVRQHDPDFVDGDTITLLDNNAAADEPVWRQHRDTAGSKIVSVSARTGASRIVYRADDFYTTIMGKHQWLTNGNLLVSEAMHGRAFEVDPAGSIVWEYLNVTRPGITGLMPEVQRIPDEDAARVIERAASCKR